MTGSIPRTLLAICVLLLAFVRVAHAEEPHEKQARRAFERGQKLFGLQKFDEALEQYQKAYDADPRPAFLYNIGQCHRNLGDYDAAIFSFKRYLELEPEADNREAVLELIDELEELAAEERERRRSEKILDDPPPPDDRRDGGGGRPFYKKWWFWGGVAAVAGAGVGTYLLVSDDGVPDSDLGHVVFR